MRRIRGIVLGVLVIVLGCCTLSCEKETPRDEVQADREHTTPPTPPSQEEEEEEKPEKEPEPTFPTPPAPSSAEYSNTADNSTALDATTPAAGVRTLLGKIDPKALLELLPYDDMTPEEYAEIKQFTQKIVGTAEDEEKTYTTIFQWIVQNIAYDHVPAKDGKDSNRPTLVLKNRKSVCQGYANLLRVMCMSQGLPTVISNGGCFLNGKRIGDHAWNYVLVGGKMDGKRPHMASGFPSGRGF